MVLDLLRGGAPTIPTVVLDQCLHLTYTYPSDMLAGGGESCSYCSHEVRARGASTKSHALHGTIRGP